MKGDYFSWLSHDDIYCENKLETQIEFLKTHPDKQKAILYSDYNLLDENDNIISAITFNHDDQKRSNAWGLLRGSLNGITMLIPTEAFKNTGGFNESLWCTQDYDKWFQLLLKGYEFIHMKEILANYRVHSNQTSRLSGKTITEGNNLWIRMAKQLPLKFKCEMNNTEYNFYRELYLFLNDTPYDIAARYCKNESLKLYIKNKDEYKKYKVSVIVPFYNNDEEEIIRAYNSIKNQTYKQVEIIFINDGSTKKYVTLEKTIFQEKSVIYIKNRINKGASYSRNYGMKIASGDYCAFLDADDEFINDKIEKQLQMMVLTDSKFSHTSYYREMYNSIKKINSGNVTGNVLGTIISGCPIATPTVMLKKDFIINNNLFYNENLSLGEDICFYFEILKRTNLLGIDSPFSIVHANSNSAAYSKEKQIKGLKNILKVVLNDQKLNDYNNEICVLMQNIININGNFDQNKKCEQCERYYNSLSWKVTKPLRAISKFIRTIIKGA